MAKLQNTGKNPVQGWVVQEWPLDRPGLPKVIGRFIKVRAGLERENETIRKFDCPNHPEKNFYSLNYRNSEGRKRAENLIVTGKTIQECRDKIKYMLRDK